VCIRFSGPLCRPTYMTSYCFHSNCGVVWCPHWKAALRLAVISSCGHSLLCSSSYCEPSSRSAPHFLEATWFFGLPYSQKPATGACCEPHLFSSPYFFKIRFNIILISPLGSSEQFLLISRTQFSMHFSSILLHSLPVLAYCIRSPSGKEWKFWSYSMCSFFQPLVIPPS
jgi:hypothetical protein